MMNGFPLPDESVNNAQEKGTSLTILKPPSWRTSHYCRYLIISCLKEKKKENLYVLSPI